MMKRILLVMAAVSALLATACVKPVVEEEHSLSVTPSTLLFEAEGGTEYLEIPGPWSCRPEPNGACPERPPAPPPPPSR